MSVALYQPFPAPSSIARSAPNVFYAFGHSHMGLTTGGITGRLLAQMMSGQSPPIDMRPYRIDRAY